jgi:hypothetical protein
MAKGQLPGCYAAVRSGDRWRILGVSDEAPAGPTIRTVAIVSASGEREAVQKAQKRAARRSITSPPTASAPSIC